MEDIAGEVEKIGNAISSDIEDYLKKKELVKLFDRHACGESKIKSILARSRKKLYGLLKEAGYEGE